MNTPRELLAWLDSMAPLYPGGVPRAVIGAGAPAVALSVEPLVTFVVPPQSGAGQALIEAAIVKGLKLSPAAAPILSEPPDAPPPGQGPVVFCGPAALPPQVAAERGVWFLWHNRSALVTLDPAEVVADPELKRVLWEDLKKVAARLGAARGA